MNEEALSQLRQGLQEWLAWLRPMLASIEKHSWTGSDVDEFWPLLKRGIIIRQIEVLEVTQQMGIAGYGHFAVVLLRPAYEELIWIKYLDQNENIARELVALLGHYDIADTLSAQNEFAGVKGMQTIGFNDRFVNAYIASGEIAKARIRKIGKTLGWTTSKYNVLPSVAFLSRKTGYEREYKFLYKATSHFVHFSTGEVFRRVWGQQGNVTIGSNMFSRYWETFAIYWGFRIFLDLIIHCDALLTHVPTEEDKVEKLLELVKPFAQVPIITPEELRTWPDRSSDRK